MTVKKGLRLREQALQKRVTATYKSPVRKEFELGEAFALEQESLALLTPAKPLKRGLGNEIVPPLEFGHSGLEETLKQPDLLDCDATIKRGRLADEAGVFELAIEAAESAKAKGAVQKMISHQLAAAHHHSLRLLGEADRQKDPLIKCKLMNTSTRLMEAFSKGALTLQKLQTGANQIVTVQHVSVNGGRAIIGMRGR